MEPRTHYQISLTARQAVGVFVGLLLALGLAFFFGLMSGLSGRGRTRDGEPAERVAEARPTPDALPAVETAVPPRGDAARGESPRGSEPAVFSENPAAAAVTAPTPPQTLQAFEDGGAEEPTPAAATSGPTPRPGAATKPAPPPSAPSASAYAGRVWVQVASVSSRNEAETLSTRLAKHGYHAVVSAEKGRLRVRVGPYRTTEEARRAADKLRKQEKLRSPWVVFEGK
ncbi:MAG TPA: SPOR domain-containing protein [Thermoanaerobaculia bacterium]